MVDGGLCGVPGMYGRTEIRVLVVESEESVVDMDGEVGWEISTRS